MSQKQSANSLTPEVSRNAKRLTPLGQATTPPGQHSQHSQDSQAVYVSHDMDGLEIELFEERAAIMEFDAGLPRAVAEFTARMSIAAGRYQSPRVKEL